MKLNPKSYLVFAFLAVVALAAIATAYASRMPVDPDAGFDSDLVAFLKRSDYALLTVSRYDDKPSSDSTYLDVYSLAGSNQLLFHHISSVDKAHDQHIGASSQLRLANVQVAITHSQAVMILEDTKLKHQDGGSAEATLDIYSGDIELDGRYYQLTLMFPK